MLTIGSLPKKYFALGLFAISGIFLLATALAATDKIAIEAERADQSPELRQFDETASSDYYIAFQSQVETSLGEILNIYFEDQELKDYGEMTNQEFRELGKFGARSAGEASEVAIVDDEEAGRVLEVRYEPQSNGSKRVQSRWLFETEHQELYLSYRVKFMPGWEYVKGGKLPGLAGGTGPSGGNPDPNGMSARLMWRGPRSSQPEERIVTYLYWLNQNGTFGDDFATDYRLPVNEWVTITQRINLGTPGNSDGSMQLWVDNVEYTNEDSMNFLSEDADWGLNQLMFSTFYGGSDSSWAPSTTTYARFNEFLVSTSRGGVMPITLVD